MKKSKLILVISILFITAVTVIPRVYSVRAGQTATTITVNTTTDVLDGADGLCSLREAVYAANNNVPFGGVAGECPAGTDADTDTITLADGATYMLSIAGADEDNTTTGDLDIIDNTAALDVQINVANGGGATIDADMIDRVLHIQDATVELNQITLAHGRLLVDTGGGVLNYNGILTMNQGAIQSNYATYGGGIYNYSGSVTGGHVTLNKTHVILNAAGSSAGIMSSGDNAKIVLNDAIIRANSTSADGGGLGIYGGELLVENSTISLNDVGSEGGGIYATEAKVTITGSLIEANEATGVGADGGGIYLADNATQSKTLIQNSTIKDNNAVDSGGGLYGVTEFPFDGKVIIQNSHFSGNQASNGGAIDIVRANISSSTFNNNRAITGNGGAGFILSIVVTDSVFTNNTAGSDGGAIYGQTVTASNIRVENNEAADSGGGIFLLESAPKDISNSVISGNTATNGGGIYIGPNNDLVTISKTAVTNNQSGMDGGGIYVEGSNLFISNSTISSNSANSNGGGLYIDDTSAVTATNITLALNTPGQDLYKVGELTLQNSIIHTPETPNCNLIVTPISSLGNNLTDDVSCGGLTQPSDEINVDVGLAPLADNGGNTLTHALLDGSPALDSGNAAACAAAPVNNVDQRGIPRTIGASCDKGAFERGSVVYLPIIVR